MKYLFACWFISFSFLISQTQLNNKTGGICFRVDDNQPDEEWQQFSSIFDSYSLKFCAALNSTGFINNPTYTQMIKNLQLGGHEIMDHSPDHCLHYFTKVLDTINYSGKSGVDHIINNKVCLSYNNIDTSSFSDEGLVTIIGNKVISSKPGEFDKDILITAFNIYFSSINKLCEITKVDNLNKLDTDTLYIKSFWDEEIDLGNHSLIQYHKIGEFDIQMSEEAVKLLVERSLNIFTYYNLSRPVTFIQPGINKQQSTFDFNTMQIKDIYGALHGYRNAASYQNASLKCFNEFDKYLTKRFSMEWGDFNDDAWGLEMNKSVIADKLAKHYVLFGHSHFNQLLGGWDEYLLRVSNLLKWCFQKNILVKTYDEWGEILYNKHQNPYVNIFPKLDVDLDENGRPDGFSTIYNDGIKDTTDGVVISSGISYKINRLGDICFVDDLGGLEKGQNEFIIYTKGEIGDFVEVRFIFQEYHQSIRFKFPAENSDWTKYSISQSINGNTHLIIPDSVSIADIRISCSDYSSGDVKISGMSLYKKPLTSIIPPWNLQSAKITSNHVRLNWIDNSDNEWGFIIEKKKENEAQFNVLAYIDPDVTTYIDTNFNSNSYYRVRAYNASSFYEYEYTNEVYVTVDTTVDVEYLSFESHLNGKKIILYWSTITESNCNRFNVERNINDIWDSIGSVSARGTTIVKSNYEFIDDDFEKRNFKGLVKYRLKQIDFDGSYSYSKVIEVNLDLVPKVYCLYQNYPNPFNSATEISYDIPESSDVKIEIFDSIGEKVTTLNEGVQNPSTYNVKYNNINSSGIYFYRITAYSKITGKTFSTTKKMICLK